MSGYERFDTWLGAALGRPGSLLLTRSMSASCCMRSARVKGAWMSTGGSDCSIVVVVWCSRGKAPVSQQICAGIQRLVP